MMNWRASTLTIIRGMVLPAAPYRALWLQGR